jgi:hypothetical protein
MVAQPRSVPFTSPATTVATSSSELLHVANFVTSIEVGFADPGSPYVPSAFIVTAPCRTIDGGETGNTMSCVGGSEGSVVGGGSDGSVVGGVVGGVVGLEKLPPLQAKVLMIEARTTTRLASPILNIYNLQFVCQPHPAIPKMRAVIRRSANVHVMAVIAKRPSDKRGGGGNASHFNYFSTFLKPASR